MNAMQSAPPKPWERHQASRQRDATASAVSTEAGDSGTRSSDPAPGSKDRTESGTVIASSGGSSTEAPAPPLPTAVSNPSIYYNSGANSGGGRMGYFDYGDSPLWSTGGSYPNYGGENSGDYGSVRGYGRLGFAAATPYASSYGYGRNGLSFSPYSSSAVYIPSGSSSTSSSSSPALSHSFLQQTAEGLGRVSLLLDLNGCFLDRLCDHSGNLFIRLNSLSASFRHLLAFLTSHVSRHWTSGYLAISTLRGRYGLHGSANDGTASSDPPRPPILLPQFLAKSLVTACAKLSKPTRQKFQRLLRRHNLVCIVPKSERSSSRQPESPSAPCSTQLGLPGGEHKESPCRMAEQGSLTSGKFGRAELSNQGSSNADPEPQREAPRPVCQEAEQPGEALSPEEKLAVLWSELRMTIMKIRVYCVTLLLLCLLGGRFKSVFGRFGAVSAVAAVLGLGAAAAAARHQLPQKRLRQQET